MTWKAINAAYHNGHGLDLTAKAVLVALAYHVNHNGRAWPSNAVLAEDVGCSVRTVRRAKARLAEHGLISVIHKKGTVDTVSLTVDTVSGGLGQPRHKNLKEPQEPRTDAAPDGASVRKGRILTGTALRRAMDPEVIAACVWCDEFGWLWQQDGAIAGRCSHQVRRAVTSLTVPSDWQEVRS